MDLITSETQTYWADNTLCFVGNLHFYQWRNMPVHLRVCGGRFRNIWT